MFNVEIDLKWFVIGEAIIAMHPLTNGLITLFFLRPYRRALKRIYPALGQNLLWKNNNRYYNSIEHHPKNGETISVKANNVTNHKLLENNSSVVFDEENETSTAAVSL